MLSLRCSTAMNPFFSLLRKNHNYRYTWTGQVVSEIGDHFNNVAVLSLAIRLTHRGDVISGIMLSRAIPAVLAGPLAGVLLDRFDRRKIMIASDLLRACIALGFILAIFYRQTWLLYLLSALLMLASPFFTSGRSAILPTIATKEELHTGQFAYTDYRLDDARRGRVSSAGRGGSVWLSDRLRVQFAFVSGFGILHLAAIPARPRVPPPRASVTESEVVRPWHEYVEGLRYMRSRPLILGIGMIALGWATGGGAAQILFSIFGEIVFNRGPAGIGTIWGCAGLGLLLGGAVAYKMGPRLSFENYKRIIVVCYICHGGSYILFSQMRSFAWALVFIAMSRVAVGVSATLNMMQLLRHVADGYRGRVFATIESVQWSVMMVSMTLAGIASQYWDRAPSAPSPAR